jgi:hypothetical protein
MNTYNLNLSSNSTNYVKILPEVNFDDITNFTISFDHMDESFIPISINIDWGDANTEFYDNNVNQTGLTLINNFNVSPIFLNTYTHKYYPSTNSLYKSLSGQILVKYSNFDQSWFIFPIKIRTYDYFESVYDLELINTNILPDIGNPKQHQLVTDIGKFLVEVRND